MSSRDCEISLTPPPLTLHPSEYHLSSRGRQAVSNVSAEPGVHLTNRLNKLNLLDLFQTKDLM